MKKDISTKRNFEIGGTEPNFDDFLNFFKVWGLLLLTRVKNYWPMATGE